MFLGEHDHTIDDKNRLTLPAKFRQAFAGGVVLSRGLESCVNAYPKAEWEQLVGARLASLDPFTSDGRRLQRFYLAGATEAEVDKQGRIPIPPALAEHAGLGREVVIVGLNERLEIWERRRWREHLKELEGSAERVAESVAAKRD